MSFKKYFACLLVMSFVISSFGTVDASAAEKLVAAPAIFHDVVVTGSVVKGIALCEDVQSDEVTTGDMVTVDEIKVPTASADKVLADRRKAQSASEKKAKKIADQKKAAKKKYKKALRLLAAIVYCEAGGQCYAGRLAVAAVVMNRVEAGGYPNTIRGVLWQPYQFGPIRQGKMARELRYYDQGLYNEPEREGSLKAAKDILAGKYTVNYNGKKINLKLYHNFNGHLSNAKIRISGHDFA